MKKEIKKIGNSVGVIFNQEEQKIYELKVGDIVDLSEMCKVNMHKKSKKKEKKGFDLGKILDSVPK